MSVPKTLAFTILGPGKKKRQTTTKTTMSEAKPSSATAARRQFALRRASSLAVEGKGKEKAKTATEYVQITKTALEFRVASLNAELKLLDEVSAMSDGEKLKTLFELLDKDSDGKVDAIELADGLRKVRGDVNFEESVSLAIDRVSRFDKDHDAKLSLKEFREYVDIFSDKLGSPFSEVAGMLVVSVLFADTGNTATENAVATSKAGQVNDIVKATEEINDESLSQEIVQSRMRALFDIFDVDGSGAVDFKEVVLGLYTITENIDGVSKTAITALIMFDKDGSRSLDYEQFSRFIINVVAAAPEHITFVDIADTITSFAINGSDQDLTIEKITEMFAMDNSMKQVMNLEAATQEEVDKLKAVQIGRVNKLFDCWDLNGDSSISFHELALGLR